MKLISEKRINELKVLATRWKLAVGNITSLYFFPAALQTATFTGAIYFHGSISLGDAFLIMNIFRILVAPIRSLP